MSCALCFLQRCLDSDYNNNFYHLILWDYWELCISFCHYHCSISDLKHLSLWNWFRHGLPCFSPPFKKILLFNCLYKGWFKEKSFLHQLRGGVASAERYVTVPVTSQLQIAMALPVYCVTLGFIIWIQRSGHSNRAVRIQESKYSYFKLLF